MAEEENLSEPVPCALSSHALQCEPQGPPKFHLALLYGLLILHIKPKYMKGEKCNFKDEHRQHKQIMQDVSEQIRKKTNTRFPKVNCKGTDNRMKIYISLAKRM